MRKILIPILLLAMFFPGLSFADKRDFTVVNDTGYPIKGIYINPPGDNVYNENELDVVLPQGGQMIIHFGQGDKGCEWNMKVIWADDNTSSIWKGMNLCAINTVTLKYNRATDTASYAAK